MESNRHLLSKKEAGKKTGVAVAVVALSLSGCSGGGKAKAMPIPVEVSQPAGTLATTPSEGITLTFDDLGGGSSIIEVYPGVRDTPKDRQYNGTYNSGDTASAECKATGRTVHSIPSAGEANRSSNEWIRLRTQGEQQYATAVYVGDPTALLGRLTLCSDIR